MIVSKKLRGVSDCDSEDGDVRGGFGVPVIVVAVGGAPPLSASKLRRELCRRKNNVKTKIIITLFKVCIVCVVSYRVVRVSFS